MVKVFLSHQSRDADSAKFVAVHLRVNHGIECYLDVIDPYINRPGEDLADHIRSQMGACTQLLAVVSDQTKASQWVPWEIGVATEKQFPLATFSTDGMKPPEFLQKWPYLRSLTDLDRYAAASKEAERTFVRKRSATFSETASRASSTREFYTTLRASLGQIM